MGAKNNLLSPPYRSFILCFVEEMFGFGTNFYEKSFDLSPAEPSLFPMVTLDVLLLQKKVSLYVNIYLEENFDGCEK